MSTKTQREAIFQKLKYIPSKEQLTIHDAPERIKLTAGGERAGKSKSAAMEYMGKFWETPLLWLVAQDYERCRGEWDYICESFDRLGLPYEASKRIDPGEISVSNGQFLIVTKSAKDPRKIAVKAPDGILACEASQLDYETYLRILGRASEKNGWIYLSGTFESSLGWYPSLYQRWLAPNAEGGRSFSLPTWSNLACYPGGREDPKIKLLETSSSPDWFMERYGGIPCPPKGLVFDSFRNEVHTGLGGKFDFEPTYPVYLWIDPGYSHYYAVLVVQKKGDEVYIVDEIYEHGLTNSQVVVAAKQRDWFNKVVGGAIDVAGTFHQGMGTPSSEIWASEGNIQLSSQKISIRDGIERVKTLLMVNPLTNRPKLHINATCRGLISEMGGCANPHTDRQEVYKYRLDKDNRVMGDEPDDKHNDACKALAYGAVDLLGYTDAKPKAKVKYF